MHSAMQSLWTGNVFGTMTLMMSNVQVRLAAAATLLAPYAVPHGGRMGRVHPEPEDLMRFPFQRDRDRIIHTQAFRRLQGKTQVFVAGASDHYRTRLTHTMEVSQISRDLARALELNEDLAECIALAHDLGHPPFGHSGEEALDAWMRSHGSHFEHNEQSHRIVTLLEIHSSLFPGLNLQREISGALFKHSPRPPSTVEAELVNTCDEIAYIGHDCDDGLAAGLFPLSDLLMIPLAKRAEEHRRARGTSIRGALIHLLAEDLIDQSRARPHLAFSPTLREEIQLLRAFLSERMYFHPSVRTRAEEGKDIVTRLCTAYIATPALKVLELQERTGGTIVEAVKDYVAGMTDAYATAMAGLL